MIYCQEFTFNVTYLHVKAHQDDHLDFNELTRPSQLNVTADIKAKVWIQRLDSSDLPRQEVLPLEPVAVFIGKEMVTSDSSD